MKGSQGGTRLTLEDRGEGWLEPKNVCTKNGPIRLSLCPYCKIRFPPTCTMVTLVRGGGGVLLWLSAVLM